MLDADHIVTSLQAAWQQPNAGCRESYGSTLPRYRTIAGSAEDQITPDGISNPYWDVVRWMPAEPYWNGSALEPTHCYRAFTKKTGVELDALGANRQQLVKEFAWSVVSPGDISWMTGQLDGRSVVEIGAGTGYWAWQLEQAGVDVAAYDPNPPVDGNDFCTGGPYTTVLRDDASAVKHHQDRALLMVWPPSAGSHARHGTPCPCTRATYSSTRVRAGKAARPTISSTSCWRPSGMRCRSLHST